MPAPVSITAPNSPKKRGGKTSYGGSRPSPSGGHTAPAQSAPTVTTVTPSGTVTSSGPSAGQGRKLARASLQRVKRINTAVRIVHQHEHQREQDLLKQTRQRFMQWSNQPEDKRGDMPKVGDHFAQDWLNHHDSKWAYYEDGGRQPVAKAAKEEAAYNAATAHPVKVAEVKYDHLWDRAKKLYPDPTQPPVVIQTSKAAVAHVQGKGKIPAAAWVSDDTVHLTPKTAQQLAMNDPAQKKTLLHEWTHVEQKPSLMGKHNPVEGGAEAFAQYASKRLGLAKDLALGHPTPVYPRETRQVRSNRGKRFIRHGQFDHLGHAVTPPVGKKLKKLKNVKAQGASPGHKKHQKKQSLDRRVTHYLGRKTVGKPTLKELRRALMKGDLRFTKDGKVVTPSVRHIKKELKQIKGDSSSTTQLQAQFPELSADKIKALQDAEKKTGTPAALLASITHFESDSGRSTLPGVHSGQNSAGAAGPFQMGNGTGAAGDAWQTYASAAWGPKASEHSPYNFHDAAVAAGEYLKAAGATKDPSTWYDAGYSYNHADWYAKEVADKAGQYAQADWNANPLTAHDKQIIAKAKKFGLTPAINPGAGKPPKQVVTRFKAIIKAADHLDKEHLPYVLGGGHVAGDAPEGTPLDCSSTVSYVLQHAGIDIPTITSGDFPQYLKPGPGAVTVYSNSEHVFMRIGNRYFGTSHSNPSGGAGWIPTSYEQAEAESGKYTVSHVPGLGVKTALQLSVSPAPGMTTSGNTATIAPGAGVVLDSPGVSSSPIKFKPNSKPTGAEILAKLKKYGVGTTAPTTSTSSATLAELEKRYGAPTV